MPLVGETVNLQFLVGGRPVGTTNPLPIKGEVDAKLTGSTVTEATLQNNATASGNGTALLIEGLDVVNFEILGTFAGTIFFEGSPDNSAWYPISSTSIAGIYTAIVSGYKYVRSRLVFISGSVYVKARALAGDAPNMTATPAQFTYGYVHGFGSAGIDGNTDDWYAVRNANDVDATDILNTSANVLKYFDSDEAAYDTTPVWIKIPVMASGWKSFAISVYNSLGITLTIDAYVVPVKGLLRGVSPITGKLSYHQIVSGQGLAHAAVPLKFGPGGITFTNSSQMPIGWVVIKATTAIDPPAGGHWSLVVERSK